MTRAAAIAALTALAAVAAIIAADFTPPVSAQSEDETTGRIVARRLDDGRIEFGWQPSGGARILPRQRYFPADATVDRWLYSSPVTVTGTIIGRINARLRSNGRIEFAFTPTDGERIAPQARYFPADARVGHWLRSTEITIRPLTDGEAPAAFIAVSVGSGYSCAIRDTGTIECWGENYRGRLDAPSGKFTAVSAGSSHACGIRESGEIECWGGNREPDDVHQVDYGQTDAPDGAFTAVSAGYDHTCAIRDTGESVCWGANGWHYTDSTTGERGFQKTGQSDPPPGSFTAISADHGYSCGLRETGAIECWGYRSAPLGSYTTVSAGSEHTCAIHESGEATCWGSAYSEENYAPAGSFTAISAGAHLVCGLRTSGEIACWGRNHSKNTTPPPGSFTAVSTGNVHACAIRESREIVCWGDNRAGQTDVPPN